jgi:NADH:ubiquinone oxidoreductase subunit 5 (subunit L)/multisubunit Na+/H+ antiporter MnhA subunit
MAGWLAICGIIPFSGFWSKDEILWNAASTTQIPLGWLVWLVGTIAATCTAFYMTRLMAMTFWGKERFPGHDHSMEHEGHAQKKEHGTHDHHAHVPHESPKSMWVPLVVLAILGHRRRLCRHQHRVHRRQACRRAHEHRQLAGAGDLESDN